MYPKLFDKDITELTSPVLRRFPSLLEGFFSEQNTGLTISEGANDVSIQADMPGLVAKDIEVTLTDGVLQIKGEKKEETESTAPDRKFYKKSSRNYIYTVELPVAVDESKVDATYDNGIMNIVIPKSEKVPSKKIEVKGK